MEDCKEGRHTANRWLLAGLTTLCCGLMISATAWNFSAVAGMPEKYETKEHVEKLVYNMDRRLDRLEDKLDRIIEHLLNEEE